MNSEIKSHFDEALNSPKPEKQLINLVEELKQKGWHQLEVYDLFETYMLLLREAERETEEDAVTDVMDLIWGYCRPDVRLFPHILSNDEVNKYKEAKQSNQLR